MGEGLAFHLYCSPFNMGAAQVAKELQSIVSGITHTDDFADLFRCDRMLLHLHEQTWTPATCDALAREVAEVTG